MLTSFMDFLVGFQRWDTWSEAKEFLRHTDSIELNLVEDVSYPYYTLSVNKPSLSCKIGILGQFHGLQPTLLLNPTYKKMVIACGKDVFIIDFSGKPTLHQHKSEALLCSIFGLEFLGIPDYFLVISELDVCVIGFDGIKRWEFSVGDFIKDWWLEQEHLTILVDTKQIRLDYRSGLVID